MRLISHTFREWHIVLLVALFCFAGCAKQSAEQETVPAGNSYATGFQITPTDTGVVVEVFQPYQRVCVKEPMTRLGTMSTVQVGFLYALDAMDCLAAVCNPELIYTPVKGNEIDLGDSMKPSAERVLQAGLDALLAVNYGQYDNLEAARIEKLGVRTIYINEWQEGSPLARAEWIRSPPLRGGREGFPQSALLCPATISAVRGMCRPVRTTSRISSRMPARSIPSMTMNALPLSR